jgi:hypothetical protein
MGELLPHLPVRNPTAAASVLISTLPPRRSPTEPGTPISFIIARISSARALAAAGVSPGSMLTVTMRKSRERDTPFVPFAASRRDRKARGQSIGHV